MHGDGCVGSAGAEAPGATRQDVEMDGGDLLRAERMEHN